MTTCFVHLHLVKIEHSNELISLLFYQHAPCEYRSIATQLTSFVCCFILWQPELCCTVNCERLMSRKKEAIRTATNSTLKGIPHPE